jgi:H+/gluconate symporter-like permease
MDVVLLLKSIAGLVGILGLLIFFLLYSSNQKKQKKSKEKKSYVSQSKPQEKHDMPSLLAIIRNKKATAAELEHALELVLKYHGHIPKKLGLRSHPDFEIYAEIVLRICHHPNTNKDIIVKFDRELERMNPEYVKEINDTLTKGLNTRRI